MTGKSTSLAIMDLSEYIYRGLDAGEQIVCFYFRFQESIRLHRPLDS